MPHSNILVMKSREAFKLAEETQPKLTDQQQKTQSSFLSLNVISVACHAILNTTFTSPEQKPTWFDDLNTKLDAAKTAANKWIDDIAPQLTGSIPKQVIDYVSLFNAAIDSIDSLYQKNPTAFGATDPTIVQVLELLNALSEEVGSKIAAVSDMSDQLKTWGDQMQKAHDDLAQGATSIQNAMTDLQTDIEHMDSAIQANKEAIDKLNQQLVYCQIAVGVSIFMIAVGIALAPISGGASLVVGGLGVAGLIGGAVGWGVIQGEINNDYSKIADEQKEKGADQRQIVALKGLSTASSQVMSSIETATSTLSDFKASWALYQGELQGVVDNLNKGASFKMIIMEKTFAEAARNEWNTAVQFATDLANAKPTVDVKDTSIQNSA